MRPAIGYYLVQAWTADPRWQAQRRRMAQAAARTRPDHEHGERRDMPGQVPSGEGQCSSTRTLPSSAAVT